MWPVHYKKGDWDQSQLNNFNFSNEKLSSSLACHYHSKVMRHTSANLAFTSIHHGSKEIRLASLREPSFNQCSLPAKGTQLFTKSASKKYCPVVFKCYLSELPVSSTSFTIFGLRNHSRTEVFDWVRPRNCDRLTKRNSIGWMFGHLVAVLRSDN